MTSTPRPARRQAKVPVPPDVEDAADPELLGDRRVHHEVVAVRIERVVDPGQPRLLEQRIRHHSAGRWTLKRNST